MKLQQIALLIGLLSLSPISGAGAWDIGPFDNDDALDWIWELELSKDLSAIDTALSAVANDGSYIQAPTASIAIAAAEVVAALLGNPHPQLPDEVASWIKGRSISKDSKLVDLARRVIVGIQDPASSELAELFSESGEYLTDWKSGLSDLQQRLQ